MIIDTMNTHTHRAAPSVLLVTTLLLSSCNFKYDTVLFTAVDKKPVAKTPAAKTPVPKVEIDTNITVPNLLGGSVKSKKPYNIRAYYIDDTFTFVAADLTTVTVTYADGTQEPKVAALKMPMHFPAQPYESYNSTSEGVVKTTERIMKAEFPRVITRDEPFTLLIKGQFTQKNGTTIPFTIRGTKEPRNGRISWAGFKGPCPTSASFQDDTMGSRYRNCHPTICPKGATHNQPRATPWESRFRINCQNASRCAKTI